MEAGGYNQVMYIHLLPIYRFSFFQLGWEQEMHWHQFWTPPQDEVKGKGGSATNTVIRPKDEARHTATAHIDEEFRSRILLALQSSLPNEVDWVFNTLIKFSFASENFCLDFMPTLVDHLVTFVEPFFNKYVQPDVNNRKKNDDDDDDLGYMLHRVFCSKEDLEIFERTLQVFHIIRNFSFLDNNIRHLAHHDTLRHYLMTGITLSPSSQFAELTRQCLDILENIAPQVIVHSPDDPYLVAMSYLLLSNDRALILGAIRSLTRVAVTEVNERVLCIPKVDLMERLFQLLLVDDEELVAATLEYFYQYTSLRGDFGTQLVKTYPGNLMGLLTGFLSYKSSLVPLSSTTNHYINETIHGIPAAQLAASQNARAEQAKIPDLTDYLNLDEPFRCLGWLKDILETGNSNDTLALKECFNRYQEKFSGNKPFGLKEFYTVLVIAFPQPAEVQKAAAGPAPLIDLVLQNIKYGPDKRHEGKNHL
ncbi:uncharacterized protein BX664DRAFT_367263 [Halteromyces radiatus]|uniref:uncharacterized protein n=1 Tax=Halteromyces radiatus TaxID=101107 RepID=UPI00221F1A65|nr:uncharacterized protein BX664DRAFT_367263 [Halteromyces radiatus]KAI8077744.1 hypothetical protein BX664DRAFT_367263 [Halteromyces radiatus]